MTIVIGTRPEAIKLAPVAKALAARGIPPRILLTGQHAFLDPASFGLGRFELVELGCAGVANPQVHAGLVTRTLLPLLAGTEFLIVQGDTSSALGGALAAAQAGVALAHVEAGLRSHDPLSPWPEEEFRIAIDACATLLFAPTELNADNLRREALAGAVLVTGNTAVDALFEQLPLLRRPRRRPDGLRRLLVTCHRRESWGEALHGIAAALSAIAALPGVRMRLVLHPNPRVASDMLRLLAGRPNIEFRDPCSHLEMLELMRDSDLVLSDSGGMQEEAPALGVPLLVLRDRTERPEGIASGNCRLAGRDEHRIRTIVETLLADDGALDAMRRPALPYGDGRASQRIADAIAQWLSGSEADLPEQLIQLPIARAG